jgi:hypothetical protein
MKRTGTPQGRGKANPAKGKGDALQLGTLLLLVLLGLPVACHESFERERDRDASGNWDAATGDGVGGYGGIWTHSDGYPVDGYWSSDGVDGAMAGYWHSDGVDGAMAGYWSSDGGDGALWYDDAGYPDDEDAGE